MARPNWLDDHDIQSDIQNLEGAAKSALERADEDNLNEPDEGIRQIQQVVAYLKESLRKADPLLTSRQTVSSLQTPVQQAASELNQFSGNGNQGHITNAKNKVDTVVKVMAEIRPALPDDTSAYLASLEPLNARIEELENLAKNRLADLDKLRGESVKELEELREDISSAKQTVKTGVDQIEEKRGQVENAINTRSTEFQSQLDAKLTAFDAESEERIGEKETQFESARKKHETTASETLGRLKGLEEDATDIVGVIARTGMTGGYQQDAKEQKTDADKWRRYTIIFGLAAVSVLIWSVVTASSDITTQQLVNRVLLSAAFGGLATYAGAQAHSHRKKSRRSRNLELALASLGPYLESIPKGEERNRLLAVFAYIFFGSLEEAEDGPTTPIVGAQVRELLKDLPNNLGE